MITFDEALTLISGAVSSLGRDEVPMVDAAGRVLAEPLHARSAAPRCALAAMDGYAVADASTRPGEPLLVVGESCAGAGYAGTVRANEAVRIFTGAPMPTGTDRCIMQEYAKREGNHVRFEPGYGPGWHVRAAGSDFAEGALLLPAGARLNARAMVSAAAADVSTLAVARVPTVAIIATGDELAPPGTAHERSDAIPESVSFGVAAMVQDAGAHVVARYRGEDDLPALERLADAALDAADVVIVTGGASVGDRDFARPMFEAHGMELLFGKLAIKPGKPVWLGQARGRWVLGLPGNPTSALVTATLFLRPLLARLQGQSVEAVLQWRALSLAEPLGETGSRETFVRARWDADGLRPVSNQQSGAQAALAEADWLVRCPAGQEALATGSRVQAVAF